MDSPALQHLRAALTPLEPFCFLGIGGSGMAPLANFVRSVGMRVTGFDQSDAANLNPELKGIDVHSDLMEHPLPANCRTIIRSSAIKENHPWLVAAQSRGLKILHRSELIALVSTSFKLITVSGTHGKSTTSAMIAYLLETLGDHPSYILGAALLGGNEAQGASSHVGSGEWLVIESDESDGTFLNYLPQIAVVTNIDPDHMEHYGSMDHMVSAFRSHLNNLLEDGSAVLFWDHPRVRELGMELPLEKRCAYGTLIGSDVRLTSFLQLGFLSKFTVVVDKRVMEITLPHLGKHNAMNALAALATIHLRDLSLTQAAAALEFFPGVARRLALHFQSSSLLIYDDYAHNPVKIASCLAGLRLGFPDSHIIAVFQPHRYSRLEHLYQDFLNSFSSVNEVVVTPVYAAGEQPLPWVTTTRLASDIQSKSLIKAHATGSLKEAEELLQYLNQENKMHTIIITIGAGDVWTIASNLAKSALKA